MNEKFLRKKDIAEGLNCGWKRARTILASHGVHAVDFGCGPAGGPRWLESAVDAAILTMHKDAQPKKPKSSIRPAAYGLAHMSAQEVFDLVASETHVQ